MRFFPVLWIVVCASSALTDFSKGKPRSGNLPASSIRRRNVTLGAFQYLGERLSQVDANGLVFTRTRYAPNEAQPWHAHERPNFHFLTGGSFIDESREQGAKAPPLFSLVFHAAGSVHRTFAGPQGRVGLNIEPSGAWLDRYGLTGRDFEAIGGRPDARPALALLTMILHSGSAATLSDAAFETLFIPSGHEREAPPWLRRLESRLEAEEVRWSLSTLAADLGVHPVHLARVFRAQYGIALTPYLHQTRLLRAARRLEGADCLTTVALEAGFADHAHLSRSFKAWFGMTPSQARSRLPHVSMLQA